MTLSFRVSVKRQVCLNRPRLQRGLTIWNFRVYVGNLNSGLRLDGPNCRGSEAESYLRTVRVACSSPTGSILSAGGRTPPWFERWPPAQGAPPATVPVPRADAPRGIRVHRWGGAWCQVDDATRIGNKTKLCRRLRIDLNATNTVWQNKKNRCSATCVHFYQLILFCFQKLNVKGLPPIQPSNSKRRKVNFCTVLISTL